MSESYGRVVVQANEKVINAFSVNRNTGLENLVHYADADPAINDDCDVFFNELVIKGDCGCFEFDNDYWEETARRLASTGKNVGIYLHSWNEYGSQYFLAQNPQGESFSFFAGGPEDDFEVEGGDVVTDQNLQQWLAVIPDAIKKAYPHLVDISAQEGE